MIFCVIEDTLKKHRNFLYCMTHVLENLVPSFSSHREVILHIFLFLLRLINYWRARLGLNCIFLVMASSPSEQFSQSPGESFQVHLFVICGCQKLVINSQILFCISKLYLDVCTCTFMLAILSNSFKWAWFKYLSCFPFLWGCDKAGDDYFNCFL